MINERIEHFFEEYGQASLQGEAKVVASQYAKRFMVATKDQSMTFTNDDTVIDWLDGVATFNKILVFFI